MSRDDRPWRTALASVALAVALGGCGTLGEVKPDEDRALMTKFAQGTATLDCGLCSALYIFNQREVWTRYQMQDWHGLAVAVMKTGWRQDITYFFLGEAAKGMGNLSAADRYYRFAGALATGPFEVDKCRSVSRLCGTLSFPRDIYPRLQAVSREMALARAAEAARARTIAPPAPAPVADVGTEPVWVDPPPAKEKPPK